jgi:hypothetical protein
VLEEEAWEKADGLVKRIEDDLILKKLCKSRQTKTALIGMKCLLRVFLIGSNNVSSRRQELSIR